MLKRDNIEVIEAGRVNPDTPKRPTEVERRALSIRNRRKAQFLKSIEDTPKV